MTLCPRGWAVSVLSAAGVLLGEDTDIEAATEQMHLALEAAYLRGRGDALTAEVALLDAAVGKTNEVLKAGIELWT